MGNLAGLMAGEILSPFHRRRAPAGCPQSTLLACLDTVRRFPCSGLLHFSCLQDTGQI